MLGLFREETAHWSKLLFHGWIGPLVRVGQIRPITLDDLHPSPPPDDQLQFTAPLFRAAFSGKVLPALFAAFRIRFFKVAILLTLLTALGLLRPLILKELINRFNIQTQPERSGLFGWIEGNLAMASVATGCFLLLAFIRSHFLRHCFKLTWSMPGLLRFEVYESLLSLNPKERSKLTAGEFVNVATRDCDSASMLPFLLEPLLYPITIIAYCAMLVSFLGPWALLAVVALAAVVPLGRQLERKMSHLAAQVREQSRIRLGILGEIFSGIRIIKFHAWEERFSQRVLSVRAKEVSLMRERARVAARHSALSALLPILTGASVVTLVSWFSGVPSTADVFASFSVIATLVTIFSEIPDLLQNTTELKISLSRIGQFLSHRPSNDATANLKSDACCLENASFSRPGSEELNNERQVLQRVSLNIPKGSCVAIVGSIGSGKTTLLSALLGELSLCSGIASLPHPICYAPQIPWNQNASVKDNITFQLPFDSHLFERIVDAVALSLDIEQWPAGIETEVGERGINLSGGQKQRLALARTAYTSLHQGVGTIIWDDPFSALDERVANRVFDQLLKSELCDRTRIFCTHRIDFAMRADWVVVMDSGRILEQGEPLALAKKNNAFSELHKLHLSTRGHEVTENDYETRPNQGIEKPPTSDTGKLTSDELITLPVFNKKALKLYFNALAPALGFVGVIFVFLLPRLTDIGSNLWLGHWTSHPSEVAISTAVVVFAVLTFVTVVAERTRSVVLFDGGVKAGTAFFENLLSGVMNAPMRFFDTSPQGRILNRFTSDTSAIDNTMPSSVGQFLTAFIGIFASLLPVVWSQPPTFFLLIPAAILYFWLFKWVRKAQLRLNALSQVVRSPWMSLTAETLPGLSVIQSLQAQGRFLSRYEQLINRHISTGFYVIATNLWFAFRLEILGVALVGGFVVLLTVNPRETSPMLAAVGLTFSLQMIGILGNVARSLRMLENSLVSVDRVCEYSALEPESKNLGSTVPKNWPTHGKIQFTNLTASYAEHLQPVLKDISLKIAGGSKVGVIGRTGSGKSTLFLAITRILPVQKNMIFIDDIDITTIPLKELRSAVAVIPQDPVLFSGTLRDNLDPFSQYSHSEIEIALKRAHLKDVCATAQAANVFTIEENGRNLSVGERQLVCLARALLSQCRILLIDEATASVDVATDALIQQTLREEFSNCTQLIIAHRTNTLKGVDILLQLENGRVISDIG